MSLTITSHGRPIFICCSGDMNPTSAGCWFRLTISRNGTNLASHIDQSTGSSVNNPYCLCYLDTISEGTHTYTALFTRGSGTMTFSEEGALQSPNFIAFEI